MAHKWEKKWRNEVQGKKQMQLGDKNPDLWKPIRKMKDFFVRKKHFLKETKKNFPPQKKK
jgi:hypothetical protein